ncbi:iron uptake system protein EfeO [Rhodococcus sp. IEGM 1408]|uniref:iron uptake system protein EfeO n=1 Tax=Rhodococcus sp. IEGM 1408 TaxID=3082220 RepID=UPI0029534868|nr:iron uptake system protein EfeO [Rhodococcus sp. IEGM 1408]MDV8000787.1 iron uptake system protein EfeO [Rhodococcus sp. IEGM 1408]
MNRTVLRRPVLALPLGLGASLVVLAGCTANTDPSAAGGAEPLEVSINGAECPVSAVETPSGTTRFTLVNAGTEPNEFEVLAADKLRIVGERENLGPGTTTDFTIVLEPGTYYTACKPNMVGEVTGVTEFTVTDSGEPVTVSEDEQALRDEAVTAYTAYVRDQTGALLTRTEEFTTAYLGGDLDRARELYPRVRMHFERIEPTAEAFGDIDPALDLREADSQELGEPWTGWHVLEKDLWLPAGETALTPEQGREMADGLNRDTRKLYDLVHADDFTVSLDEISNGAIALLEEVATTKITGEEEIFSHTDLYDIQANLEGASVAFGTVRDLAEQKDPELVAEIDSRIESLSSTLDGYRSGEDGFVPFTELDDADRKQLSDSVNALRRPLATLTEVVVG